ncbi:putative DNA mismatch repair protein [Aspergillus undulatus]|uniref:putative DNA mismatch repair protein n=1 Tax=Aspergillus undulatus TaxID=1810928 RepID=UPI003CCD6607
MPIVALPPTTVRAIGSTSIISDPYSLTKELLDNALDAGASSIAIEISQDTVDVIQVKDNGHGIPSTDYPLVCKRTFTSKIHTVEDLRNVGGKTLGFRGEALASAAEIAGILIVSTRVKSEPVGSSLKYGRDGELTSAERVAHPVGTIVRVSNLFRQIPVRRQTAVKNCKKTLARIRKMVQAYAMAKPSVRLSFKALKTKNESGNWMYAPGKKATLLEAALKVAGTDVASTCALTEWPTPPLSEGESLQENNPSIRLVALLPKLGSDFTRFNNLGQYISIDGRPVSASRGVAQDIVKLYKTYLRSVSSRDGLSPTITDLFLCIHILCPDGAYDVNIEPSKDDVLFEDQKAVLSLIEDLLRDTYGDRPDVLTDIPHKNEFPKIHQAIPTIQENEFQPLHSPPVPKPRSGNRAERSPFVRVNNAKASNIFPPIDIQSQRRSSRVTESAHNVGYCLPCSTSSLDSPAANATFQSSLISQVSPSTSGPTQLSPTTPARSSRQRQRDRDRERYGNGSLDTWFLQLSQATAQTPTDVEDAETQSAEPLLSQLTQDRFGRDKASPNSPPDSIGSLSSQLLSEPSVSPLEIDLPQIPSPAPARSPKAVNKGKGRGLPVLEQWSARLYSASNPDENPELQKALDFENRKKAAIQERRMQLQSSVSTASVPTSSPHQNRYRAARAALNAGTVSARQTEIGDAASATINGPSASTLASASKPVLSPHDPRAYLMRIQNPESNTKRIAASKLPFEKIPDGCDLHAVGLTWAFDQTVLRASYIETSKTDLYTQSGTQAEGFASPDITAIIGLWQRRLSQLVGVHYRSTENDNVSNLRFDFSGLMQATQAVST